MTPSNSRRKKRSIPLACAIRLGERESIDYRIVPGSFANPVAGLECVTLPWRLLQEAWPRDGGLLCWSASPHILCFGVLGLNVLTRGLTAMLYLSFLRLRARAAVQVTSSNSNQVNPMLILAIFFMQFGLYKILQLPILCGIYFNNGGAGGNVILRNSAGGDGVGWGTYTKGGCVKNSIDSCTKTQTQNNILYRLTVSCFFWYSSSVFILSQVTPSNSRKTSGSPRGVCIVLIQIVSFINTLSQPQNSIAQSIIPML